jgi:hypothetical protein
MSAKSAVLGLGLALTATAVYPLGLGEIVQQSALGEPFRAAIPVLVNAEDLGGDELAPECFRLVARDSERASELPQLPFGRATLERNALGVQVIVASNAPTRDPVLSFTVQAGCRLRIRHEYTVLLDPPLIQEPAAEATAREATTTVRQAPRRGGAAVTTAPEAATVRPRVAPTPPHSTSAASSRRAARAANTTAKGKAPAAPASAQKDDAPRLRVSRVNPDSSGSASDIALGKSEDQIRQEIEAETVVLQRRVAELSATLERMQADLQEATAARESAERSMKAVAAAPREPSAWLVGLVLLAGLLVLAAVIARTRRSSPLLIDLGPPTVTGAGTFEPAREDTDGAAVATPRRVAATLAALDETEAGLREASFAAPAMAEQDASFDEDLLRYAQQTSGYSVLEREHPKITASVVRDWGKPKVIAYLREILVSPRKATGGFSRDAVSDLMLLQGIAMEKEGYGPDDNPWQVETDRRRSA